MTSTAQHLPSTSLDQQEVVSLNVQDALVASFLCKEEKGNPLSDKLANILNKSLRHQPTDNDVSRRGLNYLNEEDFKVSVTNT